MLPALDAEGRKLLELSALSRWPAMIRRKASLSVEEKMRFLKMRQEARAAFEHSWESVKQQIETALQRVLERDKDLLVDAASERCISHRIAVYLEEHYQYPEWNVDVEFNRMGVGRNPKEVEKTKLLPPSKGSDGARVFPDIIVHKRGPNGPNLVAIEVKPVHGPKEEIERDRDKLQQYLGNEKLGYSHAVMLLYRTGHRAMFEPVKPIEKQPSPPKKP